MSHNGKQVIFRSVFGEEYEKLLHAHAGIAMEKKIQKKSWKEKSWNCVL